MPKWRGMARTRVWRLTQDKGEDPDNSRAWATLQLRIQTNGGVRLQKSVASCEGLMSSVGSWRMWSWANGTVRRVLFTLGSGLFTSTPQSHLLVFQHCPLIPITIIIIGDPNELKTRVLPDIPCNIEVQVNIKLAYKTNVFRGMSCQLNLGRLHPMMTYM